MPRPNSRFIAPTRRPGAGKDENKISVILTAASAGYRMKSYGPRALLSTRNGIPLLHHQVGVIKSVYPNSEIIVVVGFGADKVIRCRQPTMRFVENQLHETTGEFEQLRLALNNVATNKVLYISGDLFFNQSCIDGITQNGSTILVDRKAQLNNTEIGVTIVDKKATIFAYGLENKWGHIAYIYGAELNSLVTLCNNRDFNKLYMHEALNKILEKRGTLNEFTNDNINLLKIDCADDVVKLGEKDAYINI